MYLLVPISRANILGQLDLGEFALANGAEDAISLGEISLCDIWNDQVFWDRRGSCDQRCLLSVQYAIRCCTVQHIKENSKKFTLRQTNKAGQTNRHKIARPRQTLRFSEDERVLIFKHYIISKRNFSFVV